MRTPVGRMAGGRTSTVALVAVLLGLAITAGPGGVWDDRRGQATPVVIGTPATPIGVATGPAWSFLVHRIEDPYGGQIVWPEELPDGSRVIGVEVEAVNGSDQPLTVSSFAVRLRDAAGVGYQPGAAGSNPSLEDRVLGQGERTRGWVWFVLPDGVEPVELVLQPRAPELAIALAGLPRRPAASPGESPTARATATARLTGTPTPTRESTSTATSVSMSSPAATATSEPVVPSLPTATPSPAGIGEGVDVVATETVNLRSGPSVQAEIVATVEEGAVLTVTGQAVEGSGFVWWPVTDQASGLSGFLIADVLQVAA